PAPVPVPVPVPVPTPAQAPANEVPRSAAIAGAIQSGVVLNSAASSGTSGVQTVQISTQSFTAPPTAPLVPSQEVPVSVGGLEVVQLRANQVAQLQDNSAALPSRTLFVIDGGIRLPAGLELEERGTAAPADGATR
ncbi:MAG: hypothetical protein K9K35_02390, partial [Rhodoferax sp.]|nr:hypothetical protein [Rhodoferax sp.]